MTCNEGTFNDKTGMLEVPGPVTFTRGRMTGTGTGATYDRNRDVLWLLADAQITVTADETGGGALRGDGRHRRPGARRPLRPALEDAHTSSPTTALSTPTT